MVQALADEQLADAKLPELQVVLEGVLEKRRLLDLFRDLIVFEDDGSGALVKKVAGYHQFHAVRVAVTETLRAARLARAGGLEEPEGRYEAGKKPGGEAGDLRVGVVWHTQGSGKSLTMEPTRVHKSRIKRLRGLSQPQYRLRNSGTADRTARSC